MRHATSNARAIVGATVAVGVPPSRKVATEVDFDAFYRDNYPALCRLAAARGGDWAAAEDVVQDVLADAHRRWSVISVYGHPLAWARRAVLNRTISRWRRLGRESAAVARLARRRDDPPDEPALHDDALWSAVRRLPRRQCEVVLLVWFEDLSVAEVSEILGCGPDTVRTHWHRARHRLARELEEPDDLRDPDTISPPRHESSETP
jgi:RNA polymerase sigma-70 factor (sigma-E family)